MFVPLVPFRRWYHWRKKNETVEGRLVDHHTMIIIAIVTMNICECPGFDPWFWSMSKTCNPDLVYSNLAGWISYDMFSQPFFLLILPDSCIEMFESWRHLPLVVARMPGATENVQDVEGLLWTRFWVQPHTKSTPLKMNMEPKNTQLKRKIIFQTSIFWVPALSFPGCIG